MTLPPYSALIAAAALVAAGLYGFLRGTAPGLRTGGREGVVPALLGIQVIFGGALLALAALGRSFAPFRLADPSAPHVLALLAAVISSSLAASIIGAAFGGEVERDSREDASPASGRQGDAMGGEGGLAAHAMLSVLGAMGIAAFALWVAS